MFSPTPLGWELGGEGGEGGGLFSSHLHANRISPRLFSFGVICIYKYQSTHLSPKHTHRVSLHRQAARLSVGLLNLHSSVHFNASAALALHSARRARLIESPRFHYSPSCCRCRLRDVSLDFHGNGLTNRRALCSRWLKRFACCCAFPSACCALRSCSVRTCLLTRLCVCVFVSFCEGRAFEDPRQHVLSGVRLLVPELLPARRSRLRSEWTQ